MKGLLLIAHGSSRQASNDEIRLLADELRRKTQGRFDVVGHAFLELAEPSIPGGIQRCIDAGTDEILLLPYFLSGGRHVTEDIPAEVRKKQSEHPEVEMRLCDYLGRSEEIPDLLLRLA